jgi:hypothetical protein
MHQNEAKNRLPGIAIARTEAPLIKNVRTHFAKTPELYYALGLVMLWLIVFTIIHVKL